MFTVANLWMALGIVMDSQPAMIIGMFSFFAYAWILYIETQFVEKIDEHQQELEIIEDERKAN